VRVNNPDECKIKQLAAVLYDFINKCHPKEKRYPSVGSPFLEARVGNKVNERGHIVNPAIETWLISRNSMLLISNNKWDIRVLHKIRYHLNCCRIEAIFDIDKNKNPLSIKWDSRHCNLETMAVFFVVFLIYLRAMNYLNESLDKIKAKQFIY
jgi:hypothetical protein